MSVPESLDERIAAIVQPLRDELAKIDVEITAAEAWLVEQKAARKRIEDILKRADGKPLRAAPKPRGQQGAVAERHVNYVRDFIVGKEIAERIQIRPLAKEIASLANSNPHPGEEAVRRAVHALHDRGELRLVAKGRGGSKIYAYTGGTQ